MNRQTHQAHHHAHQDQPAVPAHSGEATTLLKVHPYESLGIEVGSDGVDVDRRLDPRYSADQDDASPPLAWTSVAEAVTYVLVVEDPDAPQVHPVVHWLIWNIPGAVTSLPAGVPVGLHPAKVQGAEHGVLESAVQGRNEHGAHGWMGMAPPVGGGVHRYHFQVFALSTRLDHMGPETTLAELVNALKGTTIAAGELIGTFERPDPVADAPSPGRTGGYGAQPSNAHPPAGEAAQGRGGLDGDDPDHHAPHDAEGAVKPRGG